MNHYETLGVSRDATPKEIERAYRRKAMLTHPDRSSGDEELFKEVKRAYETLRDPQKREEYNNTLPPQDLPVQVRPEKQSERQEEETSEVDLEVWTPEASQESDTSESSHSLFMTCLIVFMLTIFIAFLFKGNHRSDIKTKPVIEKGSREDPSMVDFYGEMDLRTKLGCKYQPPGISPDNNEDPNAGCSQIPNYKKVLKY